MIYLTQWLYIKEGHQSSFEQFENIAMPLISKYNGELLLRIKPIPESIISNSIDIPSEIHIIQFSTEIDFENFIHDEERKKFLFLKLQSIDSSILIKGEKI